jgi:hypothetical protein
VSLVVSTERLGWPPPPHGWRAITGLFYEYQDRLQYEIDPDLPTATCHLQRSVETAALCGYPWECLIAVPGSPAWTDLHPDLRCDVCEDEAGIRREEPAGRSYRFRSPDPTAPEWATRSSTSAG